jgi:purine-binding chemotaxis protein CheW
MHRDAPKRPPLLPPQKEALPRYLESLLKQSWDAPLNAFEPEDLVPPDTPGNEVAAVPDAMPVTPVPAPERPPTVAVDTPAESAMPLHVQLFRVGGLTLALPVSALVAVVDNTDLTSSPAPGITGECGRLCYPHGEIRVVALAPWVLPAGYAIPSLPDRYPILVIDDGRWGLACDAVGERVVLEPATVRWRSSRTQRRWLAGTVAQPGYAILDAPQMAALLAEAVSATLSD